ncbi:DUF192 domain-containing protein [Pseudomonas sp.]|uniref:DUF192 domain-containing protein n=1 Tax=Pseudomonas sp. TaxID=306 RepID=UPI0028B0A97A|nr:DUF192 domain-containing protein [Pseudomonas sp.]
MPQSSLCSWVAAGVIGLTGAIAAGSGYAQTLEVRPIKVGGHAVTVEVADTAEKRQQGLMQRTHLPDTQGMLFVFDQPRKACFWMRDTPLPLSVAFVDERGRILEIQDMEPLSETVHCASAKVERALEMNQGWFERHAIKAGDRIQGL